jgi:hypothetical protein
MRALRARAARAPVVLGLLSLGLQSLGLSALAGEAVHDERAALEASYRFLVSARSSGGVLRAGPAGPLKNSSLPLSYLDDARYWGEYVCALPGNACAVSDAYNAADYSLSPPPTAAGALQIERVDVHNGSNIYDAATWQIAVMLGAIVNHYAAVPDHDAYALVSGENRLLAQGYTGKSELRATTRGALFVYNGQTIADPRRAFAFRMVSANWLNPDPLLGSAQAALISARALPVGNTDYQPGMVSWSDWKPVTGENAWALLLGPLQAAFLHYQRDGQRDHVPHAELAVQNALAVLPTIAAMQSTTGAVYYAPAGTLGNQGSTQVDPHEVSVENNLSLYAGLRILQQTLQAELAHEPSLAAADRASLEGALASIDTLVNGGRHAQGLQTQGLLAFFRTSAWLKGEFVPGGRADVPAAPSAWLPTLEPRAIDVNTWGIAALGARRLDEWFGFGAAYNNWQLVKHWGAYGVGNTLWGVGYSDQDGNGMAADGRYRQGVLSAEWTAGAIAAVRNMIHHYQSLPPAAPNYAQAQQMLQSLHQDESAMLEGMRSLRADRYAGAAFAGKPPLPSLNGPRSPALATGAPLPYLYASRRYLIPFGWYANPLPSTCATAWALMVADHFDPFGYGGEPN